MRPALRHTLPIFAAAWVLTGLSPIALSAARADTSNADICASRDDDAFPPQRRIAACSALIDQLKDQPAELVEALINRGTVYWYINRMDAGFTDFDRAIALDPNNARAFRERANAYRTQGRLDKALSDANQAVRLDPNDAVALNVRGNIFNNNHQYDRAIDDYNEGLRLKPQDNQVLVQLLMDRGAAYYFKADYQDAMKDYDAAIALDPKKAQAFSNRAAVYKKLGQIDRAIADGTQAIKLDPLTPEYFDNRGLDYAENGDYDRAIADYDAAIKLKAQANFLTNRGDSYYFKKDYDRAIADYDRAVALNPGFFLAYNNRGGAYDKKGDVDHAIADYEQALRINPQFDKAAENLADARQERDQRLAVNSDNLRPSFDCGSAKRAAEKAICSDPDLSRLDREIDAAYRAALATRSGKSLTELRQEQRDFLAARNTSFGNPQYNLKHAMELRLGALRGASADSSR